MKKSNQILWSLAAVALTATMGLLSCWAAEPAASPAGAKEPVDLRPLLDKWKLEARVQGGRNTCSVFTLNAAIEYAAATKQQQATRLSVEFLNWADNQLYGDQDGGCFVELWAAFAKYGVCPETDMPYQAAFDPALKPSEQAVANAAKIRELGLRINWIKEWDSTRGVNDAEIAAIKQALSKRWLVCGGFLWPKNEGPQWKDGVLQVCPRTDVMDGHSVLLVGFRDDPKQPGGGVFLIRNSAGPCRDAALTYEYVRAYMNDAAWIDYTDATEGGPRP